MRFILSRLCEEIGRSDVIEFIRDIACKKRYAIYLDWWLKFVADVDSRFPKINKYKPKLVMVQRTKHRL